MEVPIQISEIEWFNLEKVAIVLFLEMTNFSDADLLNVLAIV